MNRLHSPQFGMALKITPKGQEFLKKQSIDILEKLAKAGDEMTDYHFWDFVIDENGYNIVSNDKLLKYTSPLLTTEMNPNTYRFAKEIKISVTRNIGDTKQSEHLLFEFPNNEAAIATYNKYSKLPIEDKNLELTKMLEKRSKQQAENKKFQEMAQAEKENFISNLMNKFSTQE